MKLTNKQRNNIKIMALVLTLLYCCNIGNQQVKHITTAPVNEHKKEKEKGIKL